MKERTKGTLMVASNCIAGLREENNSVEKFSSVAGKLEYLYKTLRQLIGIDIYKKLSIFHSL